MLLPKAFAEARLATKYAQFDIRVYPDESGKETIVLRTENLDITSPVLVRVHSECLTGDMLGSLHCDCGKQLAKSLQIIAEEGGVLIYLRQEGRGIGLFEKIKSYQLQSQGYDTFEANVLLGHAPDQRSYSMVKTILDDLGIKRIRLLTNNPSKVSDIAKLGIDVVERVPLISRPNKHNKIYLETKRKKFHHLSKQAQPYFYQFQVHNAEQLDSLIETIEANQRDPLLKIGVGIAANHHTLHNKQDIQRIQGIVRACEKHSELVPVLHFSFSHSKSPVDDLREAKRLWPLIKRVQLNDLVELDLSTLKTAAEMFSLHIPLGGEHFELVHQAKFRDFVKKHRAFLVLDNSKGKGIKETKESFIQKIDVLLGYGLNDIGLCGGFGPDHLDVYFEVRRYYRINFSVDAETKLKTAGLFDVEKIRVYLLQLFRFDDPKTNGIAQTRRFLAEHRRTDWEKIEIQGHEFSVHPKVFHPGHFPSSSWFASEVSTLVKGESSFCEVGCGSGIVSCLVALANSKLQVTATDINPFASENTKLNAEKLEISKRVVVFNGDVLDGVPEGKKFDTIFWALPFGFLDPGVNVDLEETQVFDPGYRAIRKFLETARGHLKTGGRLLIGFSEDLGHGDLLVEIAKECGVKLVKVKEKVMKEDEEVRFEILEGSFVSALTF